MPPATLTPARAGWELLEVPHGPAALEIVITPPQSSSAWTQLGGAALLVVSESATGPGASFNNLPPQ